MGHKFSFSKLTPENSIRIFGSIDQEATELVIDHLIALNKKAKPKQIYLLINNGGGDLDQFFAIADVVNHIGAHRFVAIAFGECSSAALGLLLTCDTRLAFPNTTFFFHQGTFEMPPTPFNEFLEIAKKYAMLNQRFLALYAKRLNKSVSEIERLCEKTKYFAAPEALQYGVITGIVQDGDRSKSPKG